MIRGIMKTQKKLNFIELEAITEDRESFNKEPHEI
jgi:hypothetical protein